MIHTCKECGCTFTAKSTKRKFCKLDCKVSHYKGQKKGNAFIDNGDHFVMVVKSNVHGDVHFLVDSEDVERLKMYTWCITKSKTPDLYAMTKDGSRSIKLHRYLMEVPDGLITDHINRNTLDNRKSNLKICTRAENNRNMGIKRRHPTGFKYITRGKRNGFEITIKLRGHLYVSTYRKSLEDALRVRNDFFRDNSQFKLIE